jgi:hypothetical protein
MVQYKCHFRFRPFVTLLRCGDPFMSRGEVWNDVKHSTFDFSCKLPQLSDPDPVGESMLDFTNLLTEGVIKD